METKAHAKGKETNLCGAKTRNGTPCKNYAMANGRCRMHGGKSTGPKDKKKAAASKKDNKNAVTTGEYEAIWEDTLDEEEKALILKINTEKVAALDSEIKLLEIRERRMLKRIAALNNRDNDLMIVHQKQGIERDGETNVLEIDNTLIHIQNIEDALTRIQGRKLAAIQLKHKIEEDLGTADEIEDLSAVYQAIYGDVNED